jgi:hypothetical protein
VIRSEDGIRPARRDDAELAALMEAVSRLPQDGAEEVIRNLLRAALGYERTGREGYLTSLADAALVTFRTRRDAEDQKVLDAVPASPASPEDAMARIPDMRNPQTLSRDICLARSLGMPDQATMRRTVGRYLDGP